MKNRPGACTHCKKLKVSWSGRLLIRTWDDGWADWTLDFFVALIYIFWVVMKLFFWGGCGSWNTPLDDTFFWALALAYPRNPACRVFSPSNCLGFVCFCLIFPSIFLRDCLMLTPDSDSDPELDPDVSSSKIKTMKWWNELIFCATSDTLGLWGIYLQLLQLVFFSMGWFSGALGWSGFLVYAMRTYAHIICVCYGCGSLTWWWRWWCHWY